MNCNEFERSLEDLVESHRGALSPEAERHRTGCAPCATLWQDHQRLAVAVQAWRRDVPTIDLTSRVLAELQPTTIPAHVHSGRHLALAGAFVSVAAATLLVVLWPNWQQAPPVVSVAVVPEQKPESADGGVDLTESMVDLWEDVKDSTPTLPERMLPTLPHVERVWPVLASRDATEAEVKPVQPATTSSRTPLSSVVRDRVTSAFGFLGHTLPEQPQG